MSANESPKNALFTREFSQNPYPVYARLREEEPIAKLMFPDGQFGWMITRYEDAVEVLKDNRFIKDMTKIYGSTGQSIFTSNMLFSDPPDHRRLRGLVQQAFTPKLIEGMREHIQQIADKLLDAVEGREHIELIDDYAFPLPIIVISEILGVPTSDQDKFRIWSNSIIGASNSEGSSEVYQHMQEFTAYLGTWFEKVRREPGDDLISQLIAAEEAGERLSEQEIYGVVSLLIIAGHETTVNLIGNGIISLLQHPEQLHMLRDNPDLIKGAIEEMLRYNGPVEFSTSRWAGEDLEFRGHSMKRGDLVVVALDSADRDGSQFDDPDLFDITRERSRHLAFGHGIHMCLGAPLARLEGEIAVNTLLRRFPNIRLREDAGKLEWRPGMIVRGVKEIPLSL
ncbi:cytochrome P450 family protein [Saccharibacillus kuerlensis]|uniref:Cytochrome P450 n=1 Tax=Saccharibacillus kuerlensis TaxID=459527 RepID=A0ABQ2L5V5_9BACL|nr:cytochrome P450 [Saccharibacillus kuerlensis]GGO01639.1 cytochrome P450 [Saccharibacillus kuerlensis]